MCATYADETRTRRLGKTVSVLNCEIARQVANGTSVGVDANGAVVIWD
jgi:hypothetical protein